MTRSLRRQECLREREGREAQQRNKPAVNGPGRVGVLHDVLPCVHVCELVVSRECGEHDALLPIHVYVLVGRHGVEESPAPLLQLREGIPQSDLCRHRQSSKAQQTSEEVSCSRGGRACERERAREAQQRNKTFRDEVGVQKRAADKREEVSCRGGRELARERGQEARSRQGKARGEEEDAARRLLQRRWRAGGRGRGLDQASEGGALGRSY
jgi:hypothetical protein